MVKLLIGNPSGPSRSVWTDLTGMVASIGCAIHCAAMPFVISYLPSMGLSWIASESFHQWMAVICFVIGIMAFVPGWKRHRKFTPMMLGTAGVAGLAAAAFLLEPCCESCLPTQTVSNEVAEGCVACAEAERCTANSSNNDLSTNITQQSLLPTLAPFLTPVCGLILVGAHLLNHRCGCKCCATNKSSDELENSSAPDSKIHEVLHDTTAK